MPMNPAGPRNDTWHVLKKSAFFSPNGTFDRDLAEYAMTLIGTVIYVPPKDDEPGKFVPFAGDASSTLVTTLLDGTQGQTEIGRASCRERVCQYVEISVVAVSLKKKRT